MSKTKVTLTLNEEEVELLKSVFYADLKLNEMGFNESEEEVIENVFDNILQQIDPDYEED